MTSKKLSVLLIFVLMLARVVSAQTNELFKSKEKSIAIENIYFQLYIDIDKKGDTVSIKRLQDGKLHGRNLKKPWNSKETSIIYYNKGEKHGPSIIIDEKGRKSVTNYYKGYKHGDAIYYDEKQRIMYQRKYFMGKIDGKEYSYDSDYSLDRSRIYRDDVLESETTYYKNGTIKSEGTFVNFELKNQKYYRMIHGDYTFNYPNGDKRMTQFDRGLATGNEKMWTSSGQLKYESFMLNDSIRKYYYYDSKYTDSTEVKFWRPFLHPLYQSDNLGYLFQGGGYIQELRLKDDYSYKEEYHSNGALSSRFSTKDSLKITYWPNGRVESNTKIGDRDSFKKRSFDELGKEEGVEIKISKKNGLYHYIKTIKSPDLTEETYHFAKYAGNHFNYQFILRNGVLAEETFGMDTNIKIEYDEQEKVNSVTIKEPINISTHQEKIGNVKILLHRLFGGVNRSKKNYQIDPKSNSIYSGDIDDKVYEIKYLNGETKLRFELKDSIINDIFYLGLPSGETINNFIEKKYSDKKIVSFFNQFGFEVKPNDTIKIVEQLTFYGDTIFGKYFLNDQLIYFKHRFVGSTAQAQDLKSDLYYTVKKSKKGKLLKITNNIDKVDRIYYKRTGKIRFESCVGEEPEKWYTSVSYYKNGNQKQMNTSEFFHQTLLFYRSGKLKSTLTGDTTLEYNRKGDVYAVGTTIFNSSDEKVYTRVQKNKTVVFIDNKRQYKAVIIAKQTTRKVARFTWGFLKIGYYKTKKIAKRLFRKPTEEEE